MIHKKLDILHTIQNDAISSMVMYVSMLISKSVLLIRQHSFSGTTIKFAERLPQGFHSSLHSSANEDDRTESW